MTLEYGLLLGVFGTLITIVGMMIAYILGYNAIKPKLKKEPSPLDDLFRKWKT